MGGGGGYFDVLVAMGVWMRPHRPLSSLSYGNLEFLCRLS